MLLVDFRSSRHIRWHEVTQRSIAEITSGVIGISHFTNWYYYAGAAAYDFVAARRGRATNQAEWLDCYSQFRARLTLDTQLDSGLREQVQQRVASLAINPLESSPRQELTAAAGRSSKLQVEAASGELSTLVDRDRRA